MLTFFKCNFIFCGLTKRLGSITCQVILCFCTLWFQSYLMTMVINNYLHSLNTFFVTIYGLCKCWFLFKVRSNQRLCGYLFRIKLWWIPTKMLWIQLVNSFKLKKKLKMVSPIHKWWSVQDSPSPRQVSSNSAMDWISIW